MVLFTVERLQGVFKGQPFKRQRSDVKCVQMIKDKVMLSLHEARSLLNIIQLLILSAWDAKGAENCLCLFVDHENAKFHHSRGCFGLFFGRFIV